MVPVRQSDRASQAERMVVPVCQQHRIQIDTLAATSEVVRRSAGVRFFLLTPYRSRRIPVGVQKLLVPGKRPHGTHDGMS